MDKVIFDKIVETVRKCGALMLSAHDIEEGMTKKSCAADFVTKYDKKIQDILYEEIHSIMPDAHFVGEEDRQDTVDSGYAFIVDPIDGTANFVKGYKCSVVSVGLLLDGKPHMGIIYNPYMNEMFTALDGEGAHLNGKRIFASEHKLSEGISLFGTSPYYADLRKKTFILAEKVCGYATDVRRSGSAAWDLCNIAAGRAEAFFEMILSPWDYAAGACIVAQAGGRITKMDGSPLEFNKKCSVIAAGPNAYGEIFELISQG